VLCTRSGCGLQHAWTQRDWQQGQSDISVDSFSLSRSKVLKISVSKLLLFLQAYPLLACSQAALCTSA
jgi:hypothetical protein